MQLTATAVQKRMNLAYAVGVLLVVAYSVAAVAPGYQVGQVKRTITPPPRAYANWGGCMAVHADLVVVGAQPESPASGAHVFQHDAYEGEIREIAELTANDVVNSVAFDGDTIVLGIKYDYDIGTWAGALLVYELNATTGDWEQTSKLYDADGTDMDQFGHSVAVQGTTIVATSTEVDDRRGTVLVFEKDPDSGEWNATSRLVPSVSDTNYHFGWSVAMQGDLLAVGQAGYDVYRGAVHVYRRDPVLGHWAWSSNITASDGVGGVYFGYHVVVCHSTQTIVVSSPYINSQRGMVYVYRNEDGGTWTSEAKLDPGDIGITPRYGFSLAFDGVRGRIVAGLAWYSGSVSQGGAALVWHRLSDGSWQKDDHLIQAYDVEASQQFGTGVAIMDDIVVVGSPRKDADGTQQVGAVYFASKEGCPEDETQDALTGQCTACPQGTNSILGSACSCPRGQVITNSAACAACDPADPEPGATFLDHCNCQDDLHNNGDACVNCSVLQTFDHHSRTCVASSGVIGAIIAGIAVLLGGAAVVMYKSRTSTAEVGSSKA